MMQVRLVAVFIALLLAASFASAGNVQTVLAPDSTLYAVDAETERAQLEVSRRHGDVRETLIVPTTDDDAIESQARLAYDTATGTLYVVWHRGGEGIDEIRLASLDAANEWSAVAIVASGAEVSRAALQVALTHAREKNDAIETTLIHASWWSLGATPVPEYAVVAFENGRHLSTEVVDLHTLTGAIDVMEVEDTGAAAHPPLAMTRGGNGVDVVFGDAGTTALTRVRVEPRRVSTEARIWRPAGRTIQHTPSAKLVSHGTAPVQALLGGDRVVLYTPDAQFRFIIFEDGQWTPIRMIEVDEKVTSRLLVDELLRALDRNAPLRAKPKSE
jgi:hypothetical protein